MLGAGASHHTGAPLLRDFLVAARLLSERKRELYYKDSFERVFNWIDSLRGSSYYVEFDLNNLEHVFSLAEMSRQLGLDQGEQLYSDLRCIIAETLDSCQINREKGQNLPDPHYLKFIEILNVWNDRRRAHIGRKEDTFESDTIITFNYDVMLDYAMSFKAIQPEYCLSEKPYKDRFKILKLHGSTNWAFCQNCKKTDPQVIAPSPVAQGQRYTVDEGKLEFTMVTRALVRTHCKYCADQGSLQPIIIPPTWSKLVTKTPLVTVWAEAVNQIRNAFQIVVIGYSMPLTDTFFQYLLTLGLASNPRLHRVVVLNKDDSGEFKTRYERVFARSLKDRGLLQFVTGKTFEDLIIKSGFEDIGCRV